MSEYILSERINGAFKTLEEALNVAKAEVNDSDEEIKIRVDGTIHLSSTVCLSQKNLPAKRPVIIEGTDSDSGFSGGLRITDFTHYRDNIWRAYVPEVDYTRDLYIDGSSAKRTSTEHRKSKQWFPLECNDYSFANLPGEEIKAYKYVNVFEEEKEMTDPSGIATTNTEILNWKNPEDIEMIFEAGWVHRIVPIAWVKPFGKDKAYIRPLEPAFHSSVFAVGVQTGACPNYFENVFELLGKPLEWYFEKNEHMLYIGFAENDSPENHEIIIPLTERLIDIQGKLDNKPCGITFKKLKFSHTTWNFPHSYGFPEIQATLISYTEAPKELIKEKPYESEYQKPNAAIRVFAADSINFENCTFTCLNAGALQYDFGAQHSKISRNRFFNIGGSAITMGDFYLERAHHPEDLREIINDIEFSDNLIYNTGLNLKGSSAVIMGYVSDVTVSHNYIHHVPYTAISLGWGWGHNDVSVGPKRPTKWTVPTVCKSNTISYNHIHHCMMQLHDGGAIYTLSRMDGTKIIGNYIHESSGYKGEGFDGIRISGWNCEGITDPESDKFTSLPAVPGGIYLDEGSAGITVAENLVHDVPLPIQYHNQINLGYTFISYGKNYLNKKPNYNDETQKIANFSGIRNV